MLVRLRQRQKAAAIRNKAELAEHIIQDMAEPRRSQLLTGFDLDFLAKEYNLRRVTGEPDARLRARIQEVMLGHPT